MMPGSHPPHGPAHPSRRQSDYHNYHMLQQTHSPIPHNAPYYHPGPYHEQPHSSPYPPQWYNPYAVPQQYSMPPRPFQPPGTPVVVSSHPHMHNVPPVNRRYVQTPPIVHSHTPPIPQTQAPSYPTPPVASQAVASPPTPTATTSTSTPPQSASSSTSQVPQVTHRVPFYPKLPWFSVPEESFPARIKRRRRKREAVPSQALELPTRGQDDGVAVEQDKKEGGGAGSQEAALPVVSDIDTPTTSQAPSEGNSTHPTTPSSAVPLPPTPRQQPATGHTRTATKPVVPIIPIKSGAAKKTSSPPVSTVDVSAVDHAPAGKSEAVEPSSTDLAADTTPKAASPPAKVAPKSWADLVRTKGSAVNTSTATASPSNGVISHNGAGSKNSVGDVLRTFSVDADHKTTFLEPRGLVNTGNMCYMNSVLQVLVYSSAFYGFLDRIGKQAAHSFNSETPLLDAMILFMREFNIIDSAASADQLRLRLKDTELEQYGEPFAPEYVYDVIRKLPRFSHMRRGHQQDAEEFLGFLLAGLHDECVQTMKTAATETPEPESKSPTSESSTNADGWLEVGPKQKSSVTRSSGHIEVESPITKIFGGKLRSELRVPGLKNSVTLEPYQPLQLDIGSPNVNNITDALKRLTYSETLHGDFGSPRGPGTSATKQVFIESLPAVLILHLKRFQYDNTGGTQKIWKKVGYPLELEIPKEVFPPHKRATFGVQGVPKYRLIGVVYHHGKNASGGHYTVDLRRQEEREWIRIDDTIIRRIRSEEVAEGGSEEELRVLAKALEEHKQDSNQARNFYDIDTAEDGGDKEGGGWSQVNGAANSSTKAAADKKWSGVVNGNVTPSSTGKMTPRPKDNIKDNKVAYILFYQQIKQ